MTGRFLTGILASMGLFTKRRTRTCAYCRRPIAAGDGVPISYTLYACSDDHVEEWQAAQAL